MVYGFVIFNFQNRNETFILFMSRKTVFYECTGPCDRLSVDLDAYPANEKKRFKESGLCSMCGGGASYIVGLEMDRTAAASKVTRNPAQQIPDLRKQLKMLRWDKKRPYLYSVITGTWARRERARGKPLHTVHRTYVPYLGPFDGSEDDGLIDMFFVDDEGDGEGGGGGGGAGRRGQGRASSVQESAAAEPEEEDEVLPDQAEPTPVGDEVPEEEKEKEEEPPEGFVEAMADGEEDADAADTFLVADDGQQQESSGSSSDSNADEEETQHQHVRSRKRKPKHDDEDEPEDATGNDQRQSLRAVCFFCKAECNVHSQMCDKCTRSSQRKFWRTK